MARPHVVPRIIVIGMLVLIIGAVLAAGSYYFETTFIEGDSTPLFELFSDAFKVGLGAFIGVLSQWANTVFKQSEDAEVAEINAGQV